MPLVARPNICKAPRVVAVDDHEVMISAIGVAHAKALGKGPVARCKSLEELEKVLDGAGADVVILDLQLGEADVRPHIPRLITRFPKTRFLVLSSLSNPRQIAEVIRAGVHGFIHKSNGIDTLAIAMLEVWQKGQFLCERATAALMEAMQKVAGEAEVDLRMTQRESQLLKVLALGSNIKQASEKLGISEKTTYSHRAALFRKTGTLDNVGLVCYAIRKGLIEVPV